MAHDLALVGTKSRDDPHSNTFVFWESETCGQRSSGYYHSRRIGRSKVRSHALQGAGGEVGHYMAVVQGSAEVWHKISQSSPNRAMCI